MAIERIDSHLSARTATTAVSVVFRAYGLGTGFLCRRDRVTGAGVGSLLGCATSLVQKLRFCTVNDCGWMFEVQKPETTTAEVCRLGGRSECGRFPVVQT